MNEQKVVKPNIVICTDGVMYQKYSMDSETNTIQIDVNKEDKYDSLFDQNRFEEDLEIDVVSLDNLYSDAILDGDKDKAKEYELQKQKVLSMKDCIGDLKLYCDNSNTLQILGELDDIKFFIDNNREVLSNKKIILFDKYTLADEESIIKILNLFENYDNIYIKLQENTKPISLKELKLTFDKVNSIVDEVKSYNFSPLEQIIYIYDLIRDRKYKKEKSDEGYDKSRDLSKVLFGEEIVCLGYSRIFEILTKKLGIKSFLVYLTPKTDKFGHARNLIYLKDEKYGIDGIYYLDITSDRRRDDSNKFLNRYISFLLTKSDICRLDQDKFIEHSQFSFFNADFVSEILTIIEKIKENKLSEDYSELSRYTFEINLLSKFFDDTYLIDYFNLKKVDLDNLEEKIVSYDEKFNTPIKKEKLFMAIYNVRKNEYYSNPEKYPFSLDDCYEILYYINQKYKSKEQRLLDAIFGGSRTGKEVSNDFLEELEVDKDIERVKLAKTLSLVKEKKDSNEE